jgi:hypothetical protein
MFTDRRLELKFEAVLVFRDGLGEEEAIFGQLLGFESETAAETRYVLDS